MEPLKKRKRMFSNGLDGAFYAAYLAFKRTQRHKKVLAENEVKGNEDTEMDNKWI